MNIGIHRIEYFFPKLFVDQKDLEIHDNVPGKYVSGLGQQKMSFASHFDDIQSMCLTVLHRLIKNTQLDLKKVGYLEVGTETLIDKSKSIKTVLMQLFEDSNNFDVAGIDTKNACFSGTSALFNALNWLESSSCRDRLAIVVAADIAMYKDVRARPTGGAGAIAMLLGRNAQVTFNLNERVFCMKHYYDFYKPVMSSSYPIVDGVQSLNCYKEALANCIDNLSTILDETRAKAKSTQLIGYFDYFLFHCPFVKLVQKSFSSIVYEEFKKLGSLDSLTPVEIDLIKKINNDNDIKSRDKSMLAACERLFNEKVAPSLTCAKNCGNTYSASLYAGLYSLLIQLYPIANLKKDTNLCLFSYGSGYASSLFTITIKPSVVNNNAFDVVDKPMTFLSRLNEERIKIFPSDLDRLMEEKEQINNNCDINIEAKTDHMFKGQYYLHHVDDKYRRHYRLHEDVQ